MGHMAHGNKACGTHSLWDREESSRRREREDGLVPRDPPRATGLPQ